MNQFKAPFVLGQRSNDDFEESPTGCWQEIDAGEHGSAIRVVVRMRDEEEDYAPGVAAAKLIAAAPDLLEALRVLLSLHEPEGRFQPSYFKPILRQSRDAIANATGVPVEQVGKQDYAYREALQRIASGATGHLDNDTTLANIAKRALGIEVDE